MVLQFIQSLSLKLRNVPYLARWASESQILDLPNIAQQSASMPCRSRLLVNGPETVSVLIEAKQNFTFATLHVSLGLAGAVLVAVPDDPLWQMAGTIQSHIHDGCWQPWLLCFHIWHRAYCGWSSQALDLYECCSNITLKP